MLPLSGAPSCAHFEHVLSEQIDDWIPKHCSPRFLSANLSYPRTYQNLGLRASHAIGREEQDESRERVAATISRYWRLWSTVAHTALNHEMVGVL